MLCRRFVTFKPMQSGVTGYARLQWEAGYADVQMQLRGLTCQGARFFAYTGAGEARDLGHGRVNAHGEACLTVRLPETALPPQKLQALLVLTDESRPKPLMIGLNGRQGEMLDARNAALALCDRLVAKPKAPAAAITPRTTARMAAPQEQTPPPAEASPIQTASAEKKPAPPPLEPARKAPVLREKTDRLPREIFLPAIDPSPYIAATEKEAERQSPKPEAPQSSAETRRPSAEKRIPADGLKPLEWPPALAGVKRYFDGAKPGAPFDLPGWRFVYAADTGGPQGLWVGYLARDGRVVRVAYAHQGNSAPAPGFSPIRGRDGAMYQILGVPKEMLQPG